MSHAPRARTGDVGFTPIRRSWPHPSPGLPGRAGRPRTAVVTGASSGIGAAVSRRLSAEGWSLVLSGRDAARLCDVAGRGRTPCFQADLTAPGAAERLTGFALDQVGHMDLLVAGAGVGWAGEFATMPVSTLEEIIETDLVATLRLVRQVVPHMVGEGRGRVVLIGSLAGVVGVREEAVYSAAKAALSAFAEALRYELAGTGVALSHVVPGVVDTPFFERRGTPYRRSRPRPVPPERVADAVWSAVHRGRDEIYVPGWLRLPARIHGAAPALFRRLSSVFG
ncbi:SDR family NAD(P)-dependent oxidoreductase [Streptomyces nigra]|uniref:SDR family NAD(P)-dependent oxidoreductase n=1 Tax=Streptomyces nigra TaxID=1827580 RepID=UPI0035E2B239